MNTTSPLLIVDSLTVTFPGGTRPAISNCSFTLARGERKALLGLNASGKTSLLLAIAGLLDFSGSIVVDGITVEKKNFAELRKNLGFLFANPEDQLLIPNVLQDVAYSLMTRRIEKDAALASAHTILKKFSIDDIAGFPPHQLSDGQKHRVALAGTIIHQPPLLLLDEPTSSLDTPGKKELFLLLQPLPSAMLIATHDLYFAKKICSAYLFLDEGKLLHAGDNWETLESYYRW